ncbi:MAG: glycosyltransferase [Planctomycetaceae bacterium]
MNSLDIPIKIAFCITDLDPGGAERALVELVTRLDRTVWEPHVFCLSGTGALVATLEKAGIETTCFGARSVRSVLTIFRLRRALKELQPAILQTYLFHANIAGRIAGRMAGVRCIVSGIRVAERRSKWPLWIERMTSGLVARHVCVSRAVAQFSQQVAKLETAKIVVIHNGVEAARFASAQPADLAQFNIPAGSKTVLFVGRLDPQKVPFVLLKAVEGLRHAHPDVHLLFVGDGPLRVSLAEWVKEHHLTGSVHFAGWRDDVPDIMKACHCLALPSNWEGMPNVVLEAMAAGLPVVASDVEGTSEIITNHITGMIVPRESPRELASVLTLLLTDVPQARAMGRAAQEVVAKDFTWEKAVLRYDQLYRELLKIPSR